MAKAALRLGVALVLAVIGLMVLAAAGVLILFDYTGLSAWVCAGSVSVLLLGGAWGLAMAGLRIVKSVHIAPLRTVRTIVGDIKWIAEWDARGLRRACRAAVFVGAESVPAVIRLS